MPSVLLKWSLGSHRTMAINEQRRIMINRLLNDFEGLLSSSKYAKLAKCSEDTALRDINEPLDAGILVRNESGRRSTSYRWSDTHPAKS